MAHEIYEHDRLLLHKVAAWHGLGTVIQESLSPREALEVSGLDWVVENLPVYLNTAEMIPGYQAIRRSDTGEVFQIASDSYSVFQNHDLAALAHAIGSESGAKVESAGSLRNGRDVFFLLQIGSFVLPGNDAVENYALLRTTHDGTAALQVFQTSIRVTCKNTWRMASKDQARGIYFRHTAGMHDRVEQGVKAIQAAKETVKRTEEVALSLVSVPISSSDARVYFETVLLQSLGQPTSDKGKTMLANKRDEMVSSYYDPSNDNIRGNLWGAFNAVSHWTDHKMKARGLGNGKFSSLFGPGMEMKQNALNLASALV